MAADDETTALSSSFEDAVSDAAASIQRGLESGNRLLRVEFDTSGGDETYTKLKNSMEFARCVAVALAAKEERLCMYFPDTGAAALAADQWKLETEDARLPGNVRLAAFPRDQPEPEDSAFFVICPKAAEAAETELLINDVGRSQKKPVVLLNPELVDMGTTGYGFAGRELKRRLLDDLLQVYYLRTLEWGAITKTYPQQFSVYADDPKTGDYRLCKNSELLPDADMLEDIFDEFVATDVLPANASPIAKLANGLSKFATAFSKL